MITAPLPYNEFARLQSLYALNILDTESQEQYDSITRFAAQVFKVPICLISIIDVDRQWFKSATGIDAKETSRKISFCAHAICNSPTYKNSSIYLEVVDTKKDIRFFDNSLVTGDPWIRSYLGCVLQSSTGEMLGTLCLIDTRPRKFTDHQKNLLKKLALTIQRLLNNS